MLVQYLCSPPQTTVHHHYHYFRSPPQPPPATASPWVFLSPLPRHVLERAAAAAERHGPKTKDMMGVNTKKKKK